MESLSHNEDNVMLKKICKLHVLNKGLQMSDGTHYKLTMNIVRQVSLKFVARGPSTIVPFHKDFFPSGEQLEHWKLAHEL